MDYLKLYRIVEKKRFNTERFSYPFLVRLQSDNTRYAWFSYAVHGNSTTGIYVHISKILVLKPDEEIVVFPSAFDIPFMADKNQDGFYMEYLQKLTALEEHFSEEEMNHLWQDYSMRPLFHAFQCVRNYVRTHYKED